MDNQKPAGENSAPRSRFFDPDAKPTPQNRPVRSARPAVDASRKPTGFTPEQQARAAAARSARAAAEAEQASARDKKKAAKKRRQRKPFRLKTLLIILGVAAVVAVFSVVLLNNIGKTQHQLPKVYPRPIEEEGDFEPEDTPLPTPEVS